MLEKHIEGKFVRYAKSKKCIPYKFTSPGRVGVPDRMVVGPGFLFFIEFNQTGKKPTVRQLREHNVLRSLGQDVYVGDEVGQAETILEVYLDALK